MVEIPKELLERCQSITAKRPKTVIDHILNHGFVTTKELKEQYGYNHPPRAVRDVRERGIPLETFRVAGSDGRKIAAYRSGDITNKPLRKLSGRTGLSKKIKNALIEKYGSRCFIYLEEVAPRNLQIDHRIPYEVSGNEGEDNIEDFMLLCGSANRAKSWSCEQCQNWNELKDRTICLSCYWAYPENYTHIVMLPIRRLDLLWQDEEIATYEKLKAEANFQSKTLPVFVKEVLERELLLKGGKQDD